MQELTTAQMEKIHSAAMDLLKNTGVAFNDDEGIEKKILDFPFFRLVSCGLKFGQ